MAHAVVGEERVIFILQYVAAMAYSARLRADDRRPARVSFEPRDVYLDLDKARRAHRPVRHARIAFARTAPHEFPAGP